MKFPALALVALLAMAFSFPPRPSSVGSGFSVTLAWDPSPDPFVAGYKLYYGNGSRSYQECLDAGTNTSIVVSNLLACTTYYFAATAYDFIGLESDFSEEVNYTTPCPPTNRYVQIQALYSESFSDTWHPFTNWVPVTYTNCTGNLFWKLSISNFLTQ